MKVYRNNRFMVSHVSDLPLFYSEGKWTNQYGNKVAFKPQAHTIIYTGPEFEGVTDDEHFDGIIEGNEMVISASTYYIYDGRVQYKGNVWIAVWKEATDAEVAKYEAIPIFNIMKGTYTGKDMGERSITAQIDFPSRIDFQIGDYVKFEIANLMRANGVAGGYGLEKFYIYTKPTIKKVARPQSHGKAFQHTVTFYPCQYELATVKMRDVLQEVASGVIYTGYDEFSFYGGANTLMKRIMAVLNERFPGTGVAGRDYWSYQIADSVNEDLNTALEKFQFDFSDSSVMDALLKLNDAEGINTKFFINERMIYVGYKRPYITGVDTNNIQRSIPFEFMYGKTSHLPGSTNYGNLFTLTKANGSNSPITRLYAYGSDRNLHRFYCSDRIKTGRYVNKLMLPSFEDDGRTNYIDSPEGIAKFGIREGTKTFDNIYPSLRFFYYGNLRDVKYCIKLMGSGLDPDTDGYYDNGTTINKANITPEQIERAKKEVDNAKGKDFENDTKVIITIDGKDYSLTVAQADVLINSGTVKIKNPDKIYHYPIARVQCYRVVENTDPKRDTEGKIITDDHGNPIPCGLNKLIESAPPVDLAVFCHATGKVVKVVLYADDGQPVSDEHEAMGMTRSEERQFEADGKIPTHTQDGTDYIVGSCFAVHDADFGCGHTHAGKSYDGLPDSDERAAWFIDADSISIYSDDAHKVIDKDKEIYRNEVSIHQIHYTDDHWITDVYEFTDYHQQTFNRQGYSAYCWPRVNKYYPDSQSDNIEVNAVVDVGPVYIEDTDLNISQGQQQQTFDIYLRDVGFKINEQTWFGDKVFLFDTCHINFLDGKLAGYSFEMPAESDQAQLGSIYVPALKPDGSLNSEFFDLADNPTQAYEAYNRGAYWRIVAKRQETEVDRYFVPNVMLNASRGDHVVFLDIFMPDIYVRVAEQRLYKEAKKYLDANDDGDIQYSFDIDKVRPNEQPIFAIQMREGAIMRVVDDDLDVGTVNKEAMLFNDKDGLVSLESMLRTETEVIIDYEVINRTREDILGASIRGNHIVKDTTNGEWYLFFDTLGQDANKELYYENGIDVYFDYNERPIRFHIDRDEIKTIEHTGSGPTVALHKLRMHNVNFLGIHQNDWLNWDWHVEYSFKRQTLTPQTDQSVLPAGVRKYCAAVNLTEFKPSKYYEVVIDAIEPDLAVKKNGVPSFALVNGFGDGQTIFTPEYTADVIEDGANGVMSVKYKFTLSDEFDDSKDYYPAILYQSDGETEAVHVRLWSVLERDDEHLGELNYVDLAIDTVTINFNDNTREPGISLQDGQEPERLTTNKTEMVREVTATVKEESRASAWAQLAQRMDAAEILQEQTLDFYQNLVNQARQHYIQLLNLKNNIFDPDGTCKDTFLQVMMLQVGADSMNYQLKYTHYGMNGQTSNCGVNQGESEQTDPDSGKLYFDSFAIGNAEEVLDHYVYTKDQTGGRWYPIERNVQFPLHKVLQEGQEQESYPTYFIALKASTTDSRDCHWVCDHVQHKVNELDGYYYFNWGILVPVSDDQQDPDYGHYQLTETRGNAYMYGDNLICGQISTLAGNSYFDLTHGNFVLSEGTENDAALSYIDGVLTIKGVNDAGVNSILTRLGVVENQEIGGENLLYVTEYNSGVLYLTSSTTKVQELTYYSDENNVRTHTYLPAGKYVFSANGVDTDVDDHDYTYSLKLCAWGRNGGYKTITIPNGDVKNLLLEITEESYIDLRFDIYKPDAAQQSQGYARASQMQLQLGTKSTTFHEYVQHLTDAMHGSTEIAGGLVMTNLLMLKNEQGAVKAGMSGLTNNGENVAMWAGGSYQDALDQLAGIINTLPLLLTKIGIGSKIGCFNVDTADQVSIIGADGTSKFIFNTGDANTGANMSIEKAGVEVIRITTDEIHPEKETVEFGRFDFSSSYKILFQNGEDTTGKVIQLETFKLIPASCKLSKTNVVHMRFRGIMNSSSMTLSFSIYVGGKYLMGISNQSISYVDVSGGWYVFDKLFTVSLPNTLNLSSLASEDVVIDMRNISYSGGVSSVSMQLLAFGEGELTGGAWSAEDGKWNDYNLRLYHANIAARTTIGRNGLSTMGSDGVSVNFLREEGTLVFRAIGLPQKKTSTKQVISQNYSLQQFRTLLRDLIAGWNSHTQETRVAYANEMYAALPSLIKSLSMQ